MPWDFPDSPTANQTWASPSGITYQWDTVKWVAQRIAGLQAAVQLDNSSSANSTGLPTTLTFSHTVNAGSNRALFVMVPTNAGTVAAPTSVTYGGTALTMALSRQGTMGGWGFTSSIWYLVNPPVGTANVVVTMGSGSNIVATATSLFNVNQSAPVANSAGANPTSGTPNLAVNVASSNDMVLESTIAAYAAATNVWPTGAQAPQYTLYSQYSAGMNHMTALIPPPANAASVTASWAPVIAANGYCQVLVDIAAAPGPAPPAGTPVQQVATTSASVTATSLTFAHTISAGANRALFVTVTNGAGTPTGVTYAALAMTQVILRTNTYTASVWVLVNPPVGTANVVVTMSTNSGTFATANSFVNVNQTTPYANTTSAIGTTMSTPLYTLTIASPNNMVVEAFACSAGGTNYLWSTTAAVQVGFSASANPFAGAVAALPANAASYPSGLSASFGAATYWAAAAVEVAHA